MLVGRERKTQLTKKKPGFFLDQSKCSIQQNDRFFFKETNQSTPPNKSHAPPSKIQQGDPYMAIEKEVTSPKEAGSISAHSRGLAAWQVAGKKPADKGHRVEPRKTRGFFGY